MIQISCLSELTGPQVYEFLRLRQTVFMIEQNCSYEDIDDLDTQALHLRYLSQDNQLLGYLRILPPEDRRKLSIGRVVVKKSARKRGIGREIMETALKECQARYPGQDINISAQTNLVGFYASLGFQTLGDEYMDAGIPHQNMVLLSGGTEKRG